MEYDAYDFQDVPPNTYDSYDFQNVPPPTQYDSYDFQGPPQQAQQAQNSPDFQGALSALQVQDNYNNSVPNVKADKPPSFDGAAYGAAPAPTPAPAPSAQPSKEPEGAMSQIMKGLGLSKDLSDPKNLESWMRVLMGGGSLLNTLLRRGTPQGGKTPSELAAMMPGNRYSEWSPTQQLSMDRFQNSAPTLWNQRATSYAADRASPIRAGRNYAAGGEVDPAMMGEPMPQDAEGALSLVEGEGGGQDDKVAANLSPGEYVFDADIVAAVGDGDNSAGADILDRWRENLRAYKRGAPPTDIPPPTGDPMQYMPQGPLSQQGAQ